jgi:hypothetical protein
MIIEPTLMRVTTMDGLLRDGMELSEGVAQLFTHTNYGDAISIIMFIFLAILVVHISVLTHDGMRSKLMKMRVAILGTVGV